VLETCLSTVKYLGFYRPAVMSHAWMCFSFLVSWR
jgi:hypothetical protein